MSHTTNALTNSTLGYRSQKYLNNKAEPRSESIHDGVSPGSDDDIINDRHYEKMRFRRRAERLRRNRA